MCRLNHGESVAISALTFSTICSTLPSAIRVDRYPHLCDLQLADECSKPRGEINILIGSFYWSVVTGEAVRADKGPVAVNSKLGWFLSHQCSHFRSPYQSNSKDIALSDSLQCFFELSHLVLWICQLTQ